MSVIVMAETISKEQEKVLYKISEYGFAHNEWCDCDDTEEEILFEDDFFDGYKHHYRCNACGRITQVG